MSKTIDVRNELRIIELVNRLGQNTDYVGIIEFYRMKDANRNEVCATKIKYPSFCTSI